MHDTLTVRGGGVNPYGQPDRKNTVFFLTTALNMTLEIGYVLKHCVLPVSAQPPVSTSTLAFSCASPREQRIKRKPGNQGVTRAKAMLRSSTKKQSRSTLTTSCDSETFLISYSGWMAPPKVLKTF